MDQRIRDFEPLWNARVIPLDHQPLTRPALVRSTCEHWTLPEAELARWFASPTERDAILAANRTVCRYSWNELVEIDEEEARLNKELHFGYETYTYGPPAPLIQEFEQPRADWLQRTTGQDLRDPDQDEVQAPDGFPAPLTAPLLNQLPAPDPAQDDIDDYISFDKGDA